MTVQVINARWQMRRKTAAQWTSSNEVLRQGEKGYEIDTGREKNGDGVTGWNGLAYAGGGGATNLSIANRTASTLDVVSDTGADATIPAATASLAGLLNAGAPPALGITTPAAATFSDLVASATLRLPSAAPGTPLARMLYPSGDTLRYRDSSNVERFILNGADNLSNLSNTGTARTNLGAAGSGAIGSSGLTMNSARLLGRSTAGTGAPEEITLGTGLSFSGTTLNATATGGSSVSISGTVTQAMANQTTYVCTATSSDYTVTMDTSGLSAGDVVTFIFPSGNTKMVTLSCAGGLAGSTTRAMRNGESAILRWSGSTFERVGGVNRPFVAQMVKTSSSQSLTGGGVNDVVTWQLATIDPGYGVANVAANRFSVARTATYTLTPGLKLAGGAYDPRFIGYFRPVGVGGVALGVQEIVVGVTAFDPNLGTQLPGGGIAVLTAGTSYEVMGVLNNTGRPLAGAAYPLEYSYAQIEEIVPW